VVHCQAGLNRSGLIAALVLMDSGAYGADGAIELLRAKRSEAVLCNQKFVEYLLSQ
jgi:protein-tyrosine phosphatase